MSEISGAGRGSQGHPAGSVFVLPPQGQPGAVVPPGIILSVCAGICRSSWAGDAYLLPASACGGEQQRGGALEGRSGQQVNLLLTVSGHEAGRRRRNMRIPAGISR